MGNQEIRVLASHIESHVGKLLEEIENQKNAILAKAKQDALIELRNAKILGKEIIDSAIRQSEKHFNEVRGRITIPNQNSSEY